MRERGGVEYSVYPLFSPQSLIAEGRPITAPSSFPGRRRLRFERTSLYPLAGLPSAEAGRYLALLEAVQGVGRSAVHHRRDYLEGGSTGRALDLLQTYQLVSRARAQ